MSRLERVFTAFLVVLFTTTWLYSNRYEINQVGPGGYGRERIDTWFGTTEIAYDPDAAGVDWVVYR